MRVEILRWVKRRGKKLNVPRATASRDYNQQSMLRLFVKRVVTSILQSDSFHLIREAWKIRLLCHIRILIMISNESDSSNELKNVPAGYCTLTGPDGQMYLVPTFMREATKLDFESEKRKEDLNVSSAARGVSNSFATFLFNYTILFFFFQLR
jgi:hypothetical protein